MTSRDRVLAALRGEAVDRPPISFWGHVYHRESSAEELVAHTLERWRQFRWDWVKLNPRKHYHVEPWGVLSWRRRWYVVGFDRAREDVELGAITSAEGVLAMRDSLEQVEITPDLLDYIVAIVGATRRDPQIQVGASPRGGLALVQLARGQALLSNRDYVVPDDIKQVAVPALAHRLTLRPELWVRQVSADDVMAKLLSSVPTPRTDPAGRAMSSA